MIVIREGSLISKVLYMLTVTGEFPMCSISLLGNYQSLLRLINKATTGCDYRNFKTGERYHTKLLTLVGKGSQKSLRMLTGARPILEWLGLLELHTELYGEYRFTGKLTERDRRHRIAEGYAMAHLAGLEINPMKNPKLQQVSIQDIFSSRQCFYSSKQLKEVERLAMSKNAYTRLIGAVFSNKNVYAVYNTRSQIMKWSTAGEKKARINLEEISRMNANVHTINSAILFGKNIDVALDTLNAKKKSRRLEFCIDAIYAHIHYIPMTDDGVRQLRILLIEDWKEELLSALFPDEMRSYDEGGFEYDASIGRKFIFTFFDGDIAKLERFRFVAQRTDGEYEALCFPFQVKLLKDYLGDFVKIKTVKLEVIENALGLGGEK